MCRWPCASSRGGGSVVKTSASGLLTLAGATLLVVGVTVVQGMWTERWKDRSVSKELEQAATLLEKTFPENFGNWNLERELEGDAKELERAGAVGHISRLYRNNRTKARVSAFVVCAQPHDASGHTPDRCYPGAGFEIGEVEHRQTILLSDGRSAETAKLGRRSASSGRTAFATPPASRRKTSPRPARGSRRRSLASHWSASRPCTSSMRSSMRPV